MKKILQIVNQPLVIMVEHVWKNTDLQQAVDYCADGFSGTMYMSNRSSIL